MALKAPAIAQSAPFRIGLLTVKTGPLAQGGIQMEQGIATFLKEKNTTLAGRKIEFKSLESKEQRELAVKEWKKLIPTGKLPPKVKPEGK